MDIVSILLQIIIILFSMTNEFSCSAQLTDCLEPEREALLDFKTGFEDPQNILLSWQGSNCCQWWGIACENITGSVVTVNLGASIRYGFPDLRGEIRPSLMKLKHLRNLDLSFNSFFNITIPKFFGSLKNLRYLNLSNAGFYGAIPPTLGNLSRLQYLNFDNSWAYADDLEWVTGLHSLKHLNMGGLDLAELDWLGVFNKLPLLNQLLLSNCHLSGSIPHISRVNFTSLSVLDLSYNEINSKFPIWLVNISSLLYVDISHNRLYGSIPLGLSELPNLQVLNLVENENLTCNCSELFGGSWKKLGYLNLASNKLHGKLSASIGNITSLTHFYLRKNNITGRIPSSIGKLRNLNVFDVSYNQLTGSLPSSIGNLCSLEYLDASSNNLTGLPEYLEGTENCQYKSHLPSLKYLSLGVNRIASILPPWLSQLENLSQLTLGNNLLQGPIPASLGNLQKLFEMDLGENELNGTLPESFGQLSKLSFLDVSSNHLTGMITEVHFSKLSSLRYLYMNSNSLTLNVSPNWIPPFQVEYLFMGSCRLGPTFPAWLENQKEVEILDFSNASILGFIPSWFWNISSNLRLLNVSHNQLQGKLPNPLRVPPQASIDFGTNLFEGPIPLPTVELSVLDLSNNQFSGPIPQGIRVLTFLSLSGNQVTGEIPVSIGQAVGVEVINLSRNILTGRIPSSIWNCSGLKALDLGHNNLSGEIPGSIGQLDLLQTLHLNYNMLSGELPLWFLNLSRLETLDLGNNLISGDIPPWMGGGLPNLRILSLRSNAFSGQLPSELSNLTSLQILDVAENDLFGIIPASLGDLKAMAQRKEQNKYLFYGSEFTYYEESFGVIIKGGSLLYTKTLSLVTCLDLSGNNLDGELPEEITKLLGLLVLNLSGNHIIGHIPGSISQLAELSSLDLSSNKLSGAIPPVMSSMTFLAYLNLSNNDFSGTIPFTWQMTTFTESSFLGNPGLCGAPLTVKCYGDNDPNGGGIAKDDSGSNDLVDRWFYLSIGLGFAAGILVPYFILAIEKSWAGAYFGFVDNIVLRSAWVRSRTALQRRSQHRRRP